MLAFDRGWVMVIRLIPCGTQVTHPTWILCFTWEWMYCGGKTQQNHHGQVILIFHHKGFEGAEMVGVSKSRFCFETQIRQAFQKNWNSGL